MQSYSELILQIKKLTKQAEQRRKAEYGEILRDIRKKISEYGFTAKDLGLDLSAKGSAEEKARQRGRSKNPGSSLRISRGKIPPKYSDGKGNTWTGRGKQPRWVVSALKNGASLDSLVIRSTSSS